MIKLLEFKKTRSKAGALDTAMATGRIVVEVLKDIILAIKTIKLLFLPSGSHHVIPVLGKSQQKI